MLRKTDTKNLIKEKLKSLKFLGMLPNSNRGNNNRNKDYGQHGIRNTKRRALRYVDRGLNRNTH